MHFKLFLKANEVVTSSFSFLPHFYECSFYESEFLSRFTFPVILLAMLHFLFQQKMLVSVLFELQRKLQQSDLSLCKIRLACKMLLCGNKALDSMKGTKRPVLSYPEIEQTGRFD